MQERHTLPPTDDGPYEGGLYIYRTEDMGESDLQFAICDLLCEVLEDFFAAQSRMCKVGGNLPFHFRPGDPTAVVTPDVYILEDESPGEQDLPCWETWEHDGKAPSLAVEVVSRKSRKDYTRDERGMIARYEALGVREVVRFDPLWTPRSRTRRLLTHFVRDGSGRLVEQPLAQPDRAYIKAHKFWLLRVVPRRLRVAVGSGEDLSLWPSRREQITELQRQKQAEAARAEAEVERAQAEAERADRAEAELVALRAELAALRRG